MVLKYTGVEVDLDDKTVIKIGRFLIQKKSESVIKVFLIPSVDSSLDNIEEMDGTLFTNGLPLFSVSTPEQGFKNQSEGESSSTSFRVVSTSFRVVSDYLPAGVCTSLVGGGGGASGSGNHQ